RICISSLKDPRLNTLKEIKQWFIQGDKQKKDSSQCAIIQPRRLSQDMLEGLSIREMAGDSSTHTAQSYEYIINKLTITMQIISEIQSLNYGLADGLGCVLADLKQRDYRTTVKPNKQNLEAYNRHKIQIEMLSTFSYQIFQELLNDDLIIPRKIIDLEPAEASKFQYIIGWTIYKLTKSDRLTLAYEEFAKIKSCLNVLSSEQLFEKHIEYGPDILIYINNNLVSNQPLKKQFNDLLQIAYKFYRNAEYKNKKLFPEFIHNSIQLSQEAKDYLLVRLIKIYMQSRQWSWRRFKEYIPEKGSSCLRENVKTMGKEMLLENLELALGQLKIWARDNGAKSVFEKAFTLSDLTILVQAFQNKPLKIKEKKKSVPIDLLFNHLNNGSEFNEETKKK
ncbi:21125_t:CDS:2, partial [Racocetra persica]